MLLGLDTMTEPLDFAMSIVSHLESVATYPALRAAFNAIQGPVSQFYSSIPLDRQLWDAVKAVEQSANPAELSPVHRRFLEKTVKGFRRAGADLNEKDKQRLEAIDVELTQATTKFSQNVLDATNAYELVITDQAKLGGLPESALLAARESAKAKGREGWRLTLQAPSYVAAMTYLDDRALRQQLWDASNQRGTAGQFENRSLILEILRLRREKAVLLGYRDFADLVLEERMAKSGADAQAFLDDLYTKTKPHFDRENESLAQLGRELGYDTIHPWDVGYLSERQRRALYDFDEEELRPYFELDRVVAGMFDIFSRILGIKVVAELSVPAWDAAVKYYRVEDAASGILVRKFLHGLVPARKQTRWRLDGFAPDGKSR